MSALELLRWDGALAFHLHPVGRPDARFVGRVGSLRDEPFQFQLLHRRLEHGFGMVVDVPDQQKAGVKFRNEIVAGPGGRQILLDDPSGNPVVELAPGSTK